MVSYLVEVIDETLPGAHCSAPIHPQVAVLVMAEKPLQDIQHPPGLGKQQHPVAKLLPALQQVVHHHHFPRPPPETIRILLIHHSSIFSQPFFFHFSIFAATCGRVDRQGFKSPHNLVGIPYSIPLFTLYLQLSEEKEILKITQKFFSSYPTLERSYSCYIFAFP